LCNFASQMQLLVLDKKKKQTVNRKL